MEESDCEMFSNAVINRVVFSRTPTHLIDYKKLGRLVGLSEQEAHVVVYMLRQWVSDLLEPEYEITD